MDSTTETLLMRKRFDDQGRAQLDEMLPLLDLQTAWKAEKHSTFGAMGSASTNNTPQLSGSASNSGQPGTFSAASETPGRMGGDTTSGRGDDSAMSASDNAVRPTPCARPNCGFPLLRSANDDCLRAAQVTSSYEMMHARLHTTRAILEHNRRDSQTELAQRDAIIHKQQASLKTAREAAAEAKKEVKDAESDISTLKTERGEKDKEIRQLRAQNRDLETMLKNMTWELKKHERDGENTEKELAKVEAAVADVKKHFADQRQAREKAEEAKKEGLKK